MHVEYSEQLGVEQCQWLPYRTNAFQKLTLFYVIDKHEIAAAGQHSVCQELHCHTSTFKDFLITTAEDVFGTAHYLRQRKTRQAIFILLSFSS